MIHKKTWANFVLALDFKISKGCNSGVFVRTHTLTPCPGNDVGFNGIEIAIDDTAMSGLIDTGALYDLVKPAKNNMKPVCQRDSPTGRSSKGLVGQFTAQRVRHFRLVRR